MPESVLEQETDKLHFTPISVKTCYPLDTGRTSESLVNSRPIIKRIVAYNQLWIPFLRPPKFNLEMSEG